MKKKNSEYISYCISFPLSHVRMTGKQYRAEIMQNMAIYTFQKSKINTYYY